MIAIQYWQLTRNELFESLFFYLCVAFLLIYQFLKLLLSMCLLFISDRQTVALTAPLLICCFN